MYGYLYILQSEKSAHFYIGSTNNPGRRLVQHNANGVKATRGKGPWRMVKALRFADPKESRRAEDYLKSHKSVAAIREVIRAPPQRAVLPAFLPAGHHLYSLVGPFTTEETQEYHRTRS